jgi:hypothetical protein
MLLDIHTTRCIIQIFADFITFLLSKAASSLLFNNYTKYGDIL